MPRYFSITMDNQFLKFDTVIPPHFSVEITDLQCTGSIDVLYTFDAKEQCLKQVKIGAEQSMSDFVTNICD